MVLFDNYSGTGSQQLGSVPRNNTGTEFRDVEGKSCEMDLAAARVWGCPHCGLTGTVDYLPVRPVVTRCLASSTKLGASLGALDWLQVHSSNKTY